MLPYSPVAVNNRERELREHKNEVLGAIRFIASLSCVDGFVLLGPADGRARLWRRGAAPTRCCRTSTLPATRTPSSNLLRKSELTQYGTRHRAMMRYCYDKPGSLGLVVSQDGDIRAMTRIDDMLVLWENIDVQLAYRRQAVCRASSQPARQRTRVACGVRRRVKKKKSSPSGGR